MIFCCNCDSEATHKAIHHDNKGIECPLCTSCKDAYEWGQASPKATVCLIGENPEEEEDDIPEFTELWESALNVDATSAREAYFPEGDDDENDG